MRFDEITTADTLTADCPTCESPAGELCRTALNAPTDRPHAARLAACIDRLAAAEREAWAGQLAAERARVAAEREAELAAAAPPDYAAARAGEIRRDLAARRGRAR